MLGEVDMVVELGIPVEDYLLDFAGEVLNDVVHESRVNFVRDE